MNTEAKKPLEEHLDGVLLGCLSCKDYELKKPIHGNGDAPYYECVKDRTPEECEIYKKNMKQK